MADNKNKNTQVQTFDSTYPTVYFIQSKWFSNLSEYSNAMDARKEFLDVSMNIEYSFCLKIMDSVIQKASTLYEKQMKTGRVM